MEERTYGVEELQHRLWYILYTLHLFACVIAMNSIGLAYPNGLNGDYDRSSTSSAPGLARSPSSATRNPMASGTIISITSVFINNTTAIATININNKFDTTTYSIVITRLPYYYIYSYQYKGRTRQCGCGRSWL